MHVLRPDGNLQRRPLLQTLNACQTNSYDTSATQILLQNLKLLNLELNYEMTHKDSKCTTASHDIYRS